MIPLQGTGVPARRDIELTSHGRFGHESCSGRRGGDVLAGTELAKEGPRVAHSPAVWLWTSASHRYRVRCRCARHRVVGVRRPGYGKLRKRLRAQLRRNGTTSRALSSGERPGRDMAAPCGVRRVGWCGTEPRHAVPLFPAARSGRCRNLGLRGRCGRTWSPRLRGFRPVSAFWRAPQLAGQQCGSEASRQGGIRIP